MIKQSDEELFASNPLTGCEWSTGTEGNSLVFCKKTLCGKPRSAYCEEHHAKAYYAVKTETTLEQEIDVILSGIDEEPTS